MNFRSFKFLSLLLMILVAMLLVACSGGESNNAGGETTETNETDNTTNEAEVDETAEPTEGGTLVFGRGGDSTSLDPSRTTEGETFKVTKNIFETLLEIGRAHV